MRGTLCPFYYPTTTIVIDDDADFLVNLSLRLDPGIAYQLYTSPRLALKNIDLVGVNKPLYQRCLSPYRDYPDHQSFQSTQHVFVLDLGRIATEVYNAQRFAEISVVVVDYDMPEMNGLEFCDSIESPYVKKILLTGKADEKTAVEAFNRGIIDRFIMKSDRAAADKLNMMIENLQMNYFEDIAATIMKCFTVSSPKFLRDRKFAEFFGELRRKHGIIEYYLSTDPGGFLGLTAGSEAYLLIVMSAEDFRVHWEIVRDQDGPQALLDILHKQEALPYFWRTGGFYSTDADDWRNGLVPAKTFIGQTTYRFALLKDPPSVKVGSDRVLPFDDYLDIIDKRGLDADLHERMP